VSHGTPGRLDNTKEALMSVMMSWARSTLANVEHALGRSDHWFDRLLVGVLLLLAFAVVFLFVAS
jgi:hypothetical protein